jgi:uncharacterized protein (TIGR02217 family)
MLRDVRINPGISKTAVCKLRNSAKTVRTPAGLGQLFIQGPPTGIRTFEINYGKLATDLQQELYDFNLIFSNSRDNFRFKDWSDYTAVEQLLGTGDGIIREFELRKLYAAEDVIGVFRRIYLPVISTMVVKIDGSIIEGWYYNFGTYRVTWPEDEDPPYEYGELTFSCDFDVPVRYEAEENVFTYTEHNHILFDSIILVESINPDTGF